MTGFLVLLIADSYDVREDDYLAGEDRSDLHIIT